jgi:hypothetical protein
VSERRRRSTLGFSRGDPASFLSVPPEKLLGSGRPLLQWLVPRVRPYCPGCRPNADPLRELLVLRWCEAHAPTLNGPDDTAVRSNGEPDGRNDLAESDNRRWCELFHGGARPDDAGREDHTADAPIRLFVIKRGKAETFAWFKARYGDRPDATVMWDRRIGERRTRVRDIPIERREHERRSSRGAAWEAFGFVLAARQR